MGEGEVLVEGERQPASGALAVAGLEPVRLQAKEGLALNNGTQAMTGVGILALLAAERAVETAEVAGAMSLEAMRGTPDAFDEAIMRVRPQPGQAESAARLRSLLAGSEIRESHRKRPPGAGRLLPPLHAPGPRRGATGVRVRAPGPGGGGKQRHGQPADLPGFDFVAGFGFGGRRPDPQRRQLPRPDRGPGAGPPGHGLRRPGLHQRAADRPAGGPGPVPAPGLPHAPTRARTPGSWCPRSWRRAWSTS
jgi:hypothetical protein